MNYATDPADVMVVVPRDADVEIHTRNPYLEVYVRISPDRHPELTTPDDPEAWCAREREPIYAPRARCYVNPAPPGDPLVYGYPLPAG